MSASTFVFRTVQVMHGKVLSEHVSDPFGLDYLDQLTALQYRMKQSYGSTLETVDGVIVSQDSGLVTVYAMVPVLD